MMKDPAPKTAKNPTMADDRAERRAAMLKANLKRRKVQKRVRDAVDEGQENETESAKQ